MQTGDRFVYEKIINRIIEMIQVENYAPGDKLPGVRTLAVKFGCNLHTVRKAISFLEEDGILDQQPRRGCFVRSKTNYLIGKAQPRIQIVSLRKIGILLRPDAKEFGNELLKEIECAAMRLSLQVEFHLSDGWDNVPGILESMNRNSCRAALFLCFQGTGKDSERFRAVVKNSPIPVATSSRMPGFEHLHYEPQKLFMWFDHEKLRFQIRYFQELGYHNLIYLNRADHSSSEAEVRIFQKLCREYGMKDLFYFVCGNNVLPENLFDRIAPYRGKIAAIAYDDIAALQLVQGADKHQWRIPEDLPVIGVNDFLFSKHLNPALSTIRFPYHYMAERSLMRALELSNGETAFPEIRIPKLEICIRQSCGGISRFGEGTVRNFCEKLGVIPIL